VDACPTQALTPYEIDASRCISYLTIELKDQIPSEFADKLEGWAFGCDICQEVCPWNRHAVPHQNPELAPRTDILEKELADWLTLGTNEYRRLTKSSPLARVKLEKLRHSLACALNPSE
jgi:epoxyqueuosine reductase